MKIKQESFIKFLIACIRTKNYKLAEKVIRQNEK